MSGPVSTDLVVAVHATPTMAVLALTGGGMASIVDLLSVGGASRTVLEVTVPYAATALAELLGGPPAQASSVATAAAMARACHRRAAVLRGDPAVPVVGVSCTAALVSDRPKRGPHRAHVGLHRPEGTTVWTLTLDKGRRGRQAEDRVVSELVLAAVAVGCGLFDGARAALEVAVLHALGPGDVVEVADVVAGEADAAERS
jgi:nicotinamide mononucleotide (NMN) deamidase PncC